MLYYTTHHNVIPINSILLLFFSQIPQLLAMFDKKKKGYITMDDFVTFSEAGKAEDDEDAGNFIDEEEEGEEYGLSSNKPPTTITKNADCDWCVHSMCAVCVTFRLY
jgi:hypothetical protein